MTTPNEILGEYHRRIGEIFLASGQTPYRICKQLWALHAEMERRIGKMVVDNSPNCTIDTGTVYYGNTNP